MSLLLHSEIGPERVLLITELFKTVREEPGCMTWSQLEKSFLRPRNESQEFFMLEFLARNNEMTLQDKSNYFRIDSQTTKLFLTLDPDLTLKDKDFPNWWTESVKEISQKSWLPIETELLALDTNSLNGSANNTMFESWFSANCKILREDKKSSKKISSALSMSSSQDKTVEEQVSSDEKEKEKKPSPNGMKKIRIYPTENQKNMLQRCYQSNRWAYNILVERLNIALATGKNLTTEFKEIRPLVQKKTMKVPSEEMREINEQVFDSAFRDLKKALNSTMAASKMKKKKTGKGFLIRDFKFRKKKSDSINFEIRPRDLKEVEKNNQKYFRLWPTMFGKDDCLFRVKEDLGEINYSVRIQKTRTSRFFLCIPTYTTPEALETKQCCAIDPGVRTMLTGYDPTGLVFEFGKNIDSIAKRWLIADKIKGRLRTFVGKRNKRYNLKRQELQLYEKIKRMIKDCHHKMSKWLSERYHKVLLPKFETSKMLKKINRKLHRTTVRKMQGWSHYAFKVLLKHKMEKNGNQLIECTEEYTSKTCGSCGRINRGLGSSKRFVCPQPNCSLIIDRDLGAARNIYLKNQHLLGK